MGITDETRKDNSDYITKEMIMNDIHELLKDDKESINLLLDFALHLKKSH